MKKLIIVALALSMVLGVSILAYAQVVDPIETQKQIEVVLNVETAPEFGFQIWTSEYQPPPLKPKSSVAAERMGELHMYFHASDPTGWHISASVPNGGCTFATDPLEIAALKIVTYEIPPDPGYLDPDGTFTPPGPDGLTLTSTPQPIYTSKIPEENNVNGNLLVHANYDVVEAEVPFLRQGFYYGAIDLEMVTGH
jgi:hypothetical protein